jgi:hypothetical protein
MKLELNDAALEFGVVVRDALGAAGGDVLLEKAETNPGSGEELVGSVLEPLGVFDLDVRGDADELEAAAAACRAAGWWAAPGVVAERLSAPNDLDVDALALVGGIRPCAVAHATNLRWAAVDLDGARSSATVLPIAITPRKAAFVAGLDLTPIDNNGAADALLVGNLQMWTLLGMLDRALAVTVEYVQDRQQFGKPLAAFQSVQFQLTEAEVERVGVEELAKYALWSQATNQPGSLVDALALRLAALEASERVFRICHQLHGAIGFCDETTISWISRYSLPIRNNPLPLSGTRAELTRRMGSVGLSGLYSGR